MKLRLLLILGLAFSSQSYLLGLLAQFSRAQTAPTTQPVQPPAPIVRPIKTLAPCGSGDSAQINAAWAAGYDIAFDGAMLIDHTLQCPPGASLIGKSRFTSVLVRESEPGSYANGVFQLSSAPATGGTLSDVTVDCSRCPGAVGFWNGVHTDLNIERCGFLQCDLFIAYLPALQMSDVDLYHSSINLTGATNNSNSSFTSLYFHGLCSFANPMTMGGNGHHLTDIHFEGTQRGLIYQRDADSNVINGLYCDNVGTGNNDGECFLVEGCALTNFTLENYHANNSRGGVAFQTWGATTLSGLVESMDAQGGFGVVEFNTAPSVATIHFDNCELRDTAGFDFGGPTSLISGSQQVTGNTITNTAIVNPRFTHGSQNYVQVGDYVPIAAIRGAAGNNVDAASVYQGKGQ